MTIRVEFIRRRAGGRITVRPTIYDKSELRLGRATDCDVYLPDLRVGLHHARIVLLSAEKARVEAGPDYQIRVNGVSVKRRDLGVGDGAEVRIGPYKLELKTGETDGDLVIAIELVDPATAASDSAGSRKALWKGRLVPPKRTTAWIAAIATLAAFLALPVWSHFRLSGDEAATGRIDAVAAAARENWLAGAMSSAHANLVEDCAACHQTPFARVSDAQCLTCHVETRNHAFPDRLFAAEPAAERADLWLADLRKTLSIPEGRCGSCHFEHNGPQGMTPSESVACIDCHGDMESRLADTPLHDVTSFARRHPEFKPTIIVGRDDGEPRLDRITLAERPMEDNGLVFPHAFHLTDDEVARKVVTLTGPARARLGDTLDCADCHQPDAAGALFQPIVMENACADCHSLAFSADAGGNVRLLPHGEPLEVRGVLQDFYFSQASQLLLGDDDANVFDRALMAEARARRQRLREQAFADARRNTDDMIGRIFSEDGLCSKCHALAPPQEGEHDGPAPVILSDHYMPKARFDHAKHTTGNLDCADCHQAELSTTSADVLLPGITICRDCHAAPGQETARLSNCLTCHGYHDDATAPFMQPAHVVRASAGGDQ